MAAADPALRDFELRFVDPPRTTALRSFQFGDLPLLVHTMDQGPAPREMHAHNCVELVYAHSGRGYHIHGRRRYALFGGDCFVILPDEKHAFDEETRLRITNMMFHPELLAPLRHELMEIPGFLPFFSLEPLFRAEASFRRKLHLPLPQQKTMQALCSRLQEEYRQRSPGARALCASLFVQVVVFVSRCFSNSVQAGGAAAAFTGRQEAVDSAIAFLEQNHGKDLGLEQIARSAFMSASRLSHVFKEVTGTSLLDYLTRIRVERACQLLAGSAMPLSEIAYSLGFHDPSYFGRVFRKMTGSSPLAYRRHSVPGREPAWQARPTGH